MRLVCGTCGDVYDAASEAEPRCAACMPVELESRARASLRPPALARASTSTLPRERWFVRKQRPDTTEQEAPSGPFGAAEMSRLLAEGAVDWTADVWREGLSSFRPARRDELLVLAVAQVRGLGSATMRLDSVQSLLHSSDTRVEALPSKLPRARSFPPPPPRGSTLLEVRRSATPAPPGSSTSSLREARRPRSTLSPARPRTLPPPLPGAALERRTVTLQGTPPTPASLLPGALARSSLPGQPRRTGLAPSLVALLAFLGGAVVAIGPAGLTDLARTLPQGLRVQVSRSVPTASSEGAGAAPTRDLVAVAPQSPPLGEGLLTSTGSAEPEPTLVRAHPASTEVADELARLGPALRRCLTNPQRGLTVELLLEGASGRTRELQVSAPPLGPGALECVHEVFVDFQLSPFADPTVLARHRYEW